MLHLIHVEFNVNWMKKGNGFYLIYLLKKRENITASAIRQFRQIRFLYYCFV